MSTAPKKPKAAQTLIREQVMVTLPLPGERVVFEHLVGGKLAGTLAVDAKTASVWMIAGMVVRTIEHGGKLVGLERRAIKAYFDKLV